MFGYVTICREKLCDEGYDDFRAYYCGLCREIGRRCTHTARLGLSYDITFLAIVLSALDDDGERTSCRCLVKGGRRHPCVEGDRAVGYAADMGVILTYLKLEDDRRDEKSVKALFKMLLFKRAFNKAKRRVGDVYMKIKEQLDRLNTLEAEKCVYIDETADCFAKILEFLFTPSFIEDEAQRRAIAWLGYNIGRWIYIIDAYNDIEKDMKEGGYNTFICANEGKSTAEIKSLVRDSLDESLTFTLVNASEAYNFLNIKRCREVIENILFTALKVRQNIILKNDTVS